MCSREAATIASVPPASVTNRLTGTRRLEGCDAIHDTVPAHFVLVVILCLVVYSWVFQVMPRARVCARGAFSHRKRNIEGDGEEGGAALLRP